MKFAMGLEYNGAAYGGWQRQANAVSIQAKVEAALSQVADEPIDVICAGRTDKGVHALGQVIHMETNKNRTEDNWLRGVNTYLPNDMVLHWIKPVANDFHARFSAQYRRYRYIIYNHSTYPALFMDRLTWYPHNILNEKEMQAGSEFLLGEHDFSAFRAAGCQSKSTHRFIKSIEVKRQGHIITIDITANAFLYHMVRNIVGSLLLVGECTRPAIWMKELLAQGDRRIAAPTAAATGLYFVQVVYPKCYFLPSARRYSEFLLE